MKNTGVVTCHEQVLSSCRQFSQFESAVKIRQLIDFFGAYQMFIRHDVNSCNHENY
jgi:hypothetical protein